MVFANPQFSRLNVALVDEFKPLDSEHSVSALGPPPGLTNDPGPGMDASAIAVKTTTAIAKQISPRVTAFRVLGCKDSSDYTKAQAGIMVNSNPFARPVVTTFRIRIYRVSSIDCSNAACQDTNFDYNRYYDHSKTYDQDDMSRITNSSGQPQRQIL